MHVLDARPRAAPAADRRSSSNRAPTATACCARRSPARGPRPGVGEMSSRPGVVHPGGQQHLGVPALSGQPERGVLGPHQGADPAEQGVGQAAVGAVLADRQGQLVDVGQGAVLAEEVRERPEDQGQRADQHAEQDRRPRGGVERDQEDQADGDVDAGGDQRRQAGAERLLAGVPALQQRHHAGDGEQRRRAVTGDRRGEEDAPGARAGAADRRERLEHEQRPAEVAAAALATLNAQLGRRRAGGAAGRSAWPARIARITSHRRQEEERQHQRDLGDRRRRSSAGGSTTLKHADVGDR